MFVNTTSLTF